MTRAEFEQEFLRIEPQLKSYLLRLTCDRETSEDLAQDTFIKALEGLPSFQGASSLKTWVFTIATNLARDNFKAQKRFADDAQDKCRTLAETDPMYYQETVSAFSDTPERHFEIREHINFCFNCIGKTLPIEEQVALILAEIYEFKRTEIGEILGRTEGVVKHLLFESRKTMTEKFHKRCALVNKEGVCYQCSELNDFLNPEKDSAEQLSKIALANSPNSDSEQLYQLRAALIRELDSEHFGNAKFHDLLLKITHVAEAA